MKHAPSGSWAKKPGIDLHPDAAQVQAIRGSVRKRGAITRG